MRTRSGGGLVRAAIGILLLGLYGCCSIDAGRFEAFAAASHRLLDGAEAEAAQIQEVQRTYLAFAAAAGKLDEQSFEPQTAIAGGQRNFDLVRQFSERIAILNAIANYADALSAFARKDYQSGVDAAAVELDGSVAALGALMGPQWGGTAAAGYLASAVDTLGHAIIEHERIKGLRRAMALAQPGLQTLAGLLASGDELIAQQIVAYRNYILEDANDTINAAPAAINRVGIAAMVGGPVADANLAVRRLAQINQGVRLIPAAHQELADSICEDRPGLASLKALLSEAQRVATFRAHLY
jgi:hypothetical protein